MKKEDFYKQKTQLDGKDVFTPYKQKKSGGKKPSGGSGSGKKKQFQAIMQNTPSETKNMGYGVIPYKQQYRM